MGYKERILDLLQVESLTVKEISKKLKIDENQTRVYLNRLKALNKVKEIDKKGRYKVYSIVKPLDTKDQAKIQELEYDLSYIYNLMSKKMIIKPGIKLLPEDLTFLEKIKSKIGVNDLLFQLKKNKEK